MNSMRAGALELAVVGLVEVGALLALLAFSARLATLMWAGVLPLAAWVYARRRTPDQVAGVTGAACGLAAFPVSHGLFSLLVLPMPLQLLGVLGLIGEALHGIPGSLLATAIDLDRQGDTSWATILCDGLANGLVWAAVYGWIGSRVDRARRARPAPDG